VSFGFSVQNNGFCGGPNTFSQENYQCLCRRIAFVTSKDINIKTYSPLDNDVTVAQWKCNRAQNKQTPFTTNKKVEFNSLLAGGLWVFLLLTCDQAIVSLGETFRREGRNEK